MGSVFGDFLPSAQAVAFCPGCCWESRTELSPQPVQLVCGRAHALMSSSGYTLCACNRNSCGEISVLCSSVQTAFHISCSAFFFPSLRNLSYQNMETFWWFFLRDGAGYLVFCSGTDSQLMKISHFPNFLLLQSVLR